jgi:hypothetical protein
MDEQPYEEDFADDDEHAVPDDNDEEAKEAEVCSDRKFISDALLTDFTTVGTTETGIPCGEQASRVWCR